jgi:hypothetical protein
VHAADPQLGGIGCLIALHSGGFSAWLIRSGALRFGLTVISVLFVILV